MIWLFFALVFGLSKKEARNIACGLESFVVEEATVKRTLIDVLSDWDRSSTFSVIVLNGYFATGKTYIASILSNLLAEGGHPVEIFDRLDSERSPELFYDKIRDYFDAAMNTKRGPQTPKFPTLVFDDLPCWADKTRVVRTIERCLQFPEQCRGALFLITTNDGWCDLNYCNYNVELDTLLGDLAKEESEAGEGDVCDDVQECVFADVKVSREECEHRGCCCDGATNGYCDRCMVLKSERRVFDKLRRASAKRSSDYIVTRLDEHPHLVLLGHNGFWDEKRSFDHQVKLFERMLAHTVYHELSGDVALVYSSTFPREVIKITGVTQEGEMARLMRQQSQSIIRGKVRGECGGACSEIKMKRQKYGIPATSKWTLYLWCDGPDGQCTGKEVQMASVPWQNRKGENFLEIPFRARLSEHVRILVSGWFGHLSRLVSLYLRKIRSTQVMRKLEEDPSEMRELLQQDAEDLNTLISDTVKLWQEDCPHLALHQVHIISPAVQPAECDDIGASAPIKVVSAECTLAKAESLGALCEPRPLIPNPFYGSIVIQLAGYSILNPMYWRRTEQEKKCDNLKASKILLETVPVVASWVTPLTVRPPEIPSAHKQGCIASTPKGTATTAGTTVDDIFESSRASDEL